MFKLIVTKELKEIISSTKFATTFGVCSLLIVLAFFMAARGYHVGRAQYDAAVAEDRRQMEGQTEWLDVSPSVFLPPQPLAYLVPGISNDIGRNTEVRGRGGLRPEGSRFGDEPLLALFRFVDLEFWGVTGMGMPISLLATGLTDASGSLETMYGTVSSSWELDGERFRLRVAIPANTTATIRIPVAHIDETTESGRPLAEAPGITNVREEHGAVVVATGSGVYQFESTRTQD